uniref:Uncharacterized protein n=1 Tax=Rhizoctonia solani TaxID=456999 RepID=N0ABP8_9AGAM|nr:hypothetical protein RSOL_m00100 [Rhizoctonia solani]AGK45353.1 hypothetical protein RSOL_m00100 [Rhizoctonia solani]
MLCSIKRAWICCARFPFAVFCFSKGKTHNFSFDWTNPERTLSIENFKNSRMGPSKEGPQRNSVEQ